jgi:hypothetical protein
MGRDVTATENNFELRRSPKNVLELTPAHVYTINLASVSATYVRSLELMLESSFPYVMILQNWLCNLVEGETLPLTESKLGIHGIVKYQYNYETYSFIIIKSATIADLLKSVKEKFKLGNARLEATYKTRILSEDYVLELGMTVKIKEETLTDEKILNAVKNPNRHFSKGDRIITLIDGNIVLADVQKVDGGIFVILFKGSKYVLDNFDLIGILYEKERVKVKKE